LAPAIPTGRKERDQLVPRITRGIIRAGEWLPFRAWERRIRSTVAETYAHFVRNISNLSTDVELNRQHDLRAKWLQRSMSFSSSAVAHPQRGSAIVS
jgi:hypothetical protein